MKIEKWNPSFSIVYETGIQKVVCNKKKPVQRNTLASLWLKLQRLCGIGIDCTKTNITQR